MFVTLDSSARMTIVFCAGEDLQTVVCPRTQYVTLQFNHCVPLLLIRIVLIIRTPFIRGVTMKYVVRAVVLIIELYVLLIHRIRGSIFELLLIPMSFRFYFPLHFGVECGPIRANVR